MSSNANRTFLARSHLLVKYLFRRKWGKKTRKRDILMFWDGGGRKKWDILIFRDGGD